MSSKDREGDPPANHESAEETMAVEVVDSDYAPAHVDEISRRTGGLVSGDLTIEEATRGASPAVRKRVEGFIRQYAFGDMRKVMTALRQARIIDGLTNDDLAAALAAAKLAQKEEEYEREKEEKAEGADAATSLSSEVQEIADRLKREKLEKIKEAKAKKGEKDSIDL